jgi:hypothetical protein
MGLIENIRAALESDDATIARLKREQAAADADVLDAQRVHQVSALELHEAGADDGKAAKRLQAAVDAAAERLSKTQTRLVGINAALAAAEARRAEREADAARAEQAAREDVQRAAFNAAAGAFRDTSKALDDFVDAALKARALVVKYADVTDTDTAAADFGRAILALSQAVGFRLAGHYPAFKATPGLAPERYALETYVPAERSNPRPNKAA